MAIISKEGLLKVLISYNPWWKTGVVNPKLSKTYKRFAFYEAMKRLNQTDIRRTVVLTGTRRVGKTTIQYQMIEALLQNGVPPQKIVFISMDHPMLKLSAMNEILECYHENIYPEQDVVVSRVMRKFDLALAEIYFRGRVHAPWLPSSGQGAKGQGRRYAARLALDAL